MRGMEGKGREGGEGGGKGRDHETDWVYTITRRGGGGVEEI